MGNVDRAIVHSEEMRKLEALLFAAGRPLDIERVKVYSGLKPEEIEVALERLSGSYREINSAIEVTRLPSGHFVMQVRTRYAKISAKASSGSPLTLGARKTLAVVAYKQPIPQSILIRIRGSHSYKYVKELIKMGYVRGDKLGRTKMLRTTTFVNELFGTKDESEMKSMIEKMLEEKGRNEPGSNPEAKVSEDI